MRVWALTPCSLICRLDWHRKATPLKQICRARAGGAACIPPCSPVPRPSTICTTSDRPLSTGTCQQARCCSVTAAAARPKTTASTLARLSWPSCRAQRCWRSSTSQLMPSSGMQRQRHLPKGGWPSCLMGGKAVVLECWLWEGCALPITFAAVCFHRPTHAQGVLAMLEALHGIGYGDGIGDQWGGSAVFSIAESRAFENEKMIPWGSLGTFLQGPCHGV